MAKPEKEDECSCDDRDQGVTISLGAALIFMILALAFCGSPDLMDGVVHSLMQHQHNYQTPE